MTQENANAHEKALEALITASLRCPDTLPDITEEEVRRYVEQHVTLSPEDEAALEKSKPELMRDIKKILQVKEEDCPARPLSAERIHQVASTPKNRAPSEFVEAIVIAQLTWRHADSESSHPLGRKRYNKFAYLAHRKTEDDVRSQFLKKAAGPYSPWARYQGPENIAVTNGYVRRAKVGVYNGLLPGDRIHEIDRYLSRYPICAAVDWVINTFRYRTNDELELLATVDFAALDLIQEGSSVCVENIKRVIVASNEWKAKLKRAIFSDENIRNALDELQQLFPKTYA